MTGEMPDCSAIVSVSQVCPGNGSVPIDSSLQRFRTTSDFLKEWIDLHSEIGKSLGRASPVLPYRVLRRPLGPLFTRQPGYLALRRLAPE